ncbi:heat-inducible protein [Luteitalea pratensis]|uniref:Heat-inducible protein n=1 Tax=Luteitalea pratensis TaxID=1855912 RepID=A0A143PH58_LUTPR|nr:META domain-containing protein [Luteitalea pratensis]AMY07865.1 heat-inducible protein [Luteitalea pratensis]
MPLSTVVLTLAITTLVPLAGLAGAQTPPAGSTWTLVELPGHMLSGDRVPTLTLDGSRVQGSDGCNRYTGPYKAGTDGTFRVSGSVARTKMACPGVTAQLAREFMAALTRSARLRLDGSRLTLLDAAGTVLAVFEAQTQALANTAWDVTAYNNGKAAVVSVITGSRLTLAFSEDGRVSGSAGCNGFTGSYTVDNGDLSIRGTAATRKMCVDPAGVMEQESAFLKSLATNMRVRIEGTRLELRYADGALGLNATRTGDR